MHVHSAQTTLSKLGEALDGLMPPDGTRQRQGRTETFDDDLIDVQIHHLGGRDVLAVAFHADHDVVAPEDPAGDPIRLTSDDAEPREDAVEELLEAIRLTQEYAQLPAVDGWSWWDVYRKYRPADAERLRVESDRFAVRAGGPISEDEFVNDPDPMVWAKAFASRFAVARSVEDDATVLDDVAGLMVTWFANFATAWERRVRERIAAETPAARLVVIRRQENGWDRFAFVDDDGRSVAEYTVQPRHVTLVHDRAVPPEWSGVWPE